MQGLKFVFGFCDVKGVYSFGEGTTYIFGMMSPEELCSVLNHEVLHYAIHKLEGEIASLQLDNVDWDDVLV